MSKSKHTRVRCNVCGKLFNVSVHDFTQFNTGIVIKYIECSKCGQKFLVQISDWELRAYLTSVEYKLSKPDSVVEARERERHLAIQHSDLLKRLGIEYTHKLVDDSERSE